MVELLSRARWILVLRGAIALAFGILALLWPGSLLWFVMLFAVYSLSSGIVATAGAIRNRAADEKWWLILLLGLVNIAVGVYAIAYPGVTALVLVMIMGINALLTGILDIATAMRLRKTAGKERLLILSGIVSVMFGVMVLLFPGAGALALVWLISANALITGVLLLTLAVRIRNLVKMKRSQIGMLQSAHH